MTRGILNPAAVGFGATLRAYRDRKRLSITELATRAGFDHSTGSRLETGTRRPGIETVHRYADALDLTWDERDVLLMSAGYMPDDPRNLFASEPVIAELATFLADRDYPAEVRDDLRHVVGLIVRQAQRAHRDLHIVAAD